MTATALLTTGKAADLPRWDAPHDHTAHALPLGRRFPQLDASTAAEVEELQCEVCGLTWDVVASVHRTEPTDLVPRPEPGSFMAFVAFLADRVGACSLCCRGSSCRNRRADCVCRCHQVARVGS